MTEAELKFFDISNEQYRTYFFPDGSKLTIEAPAKLNVKHHAGLYDSHRVVDKAGNGWYVPAGWIGIKWNNVKGADRIDF